MSAHARNSNLPIVKNPRYSKESVEFDQQIRKLLEVLDYESVKVGIPKEAPAGFWIAEVLTGLVVHRVGIIPCNNEVEDLTIQEVEQIERFVKEQVEREDLDLGLLVIAQEVVSREVKDTLHKYRWPSRRRMVQTLQDIRKKLVNFNRYLRSLVEQYENPDPRQLDSPPPMEKIYVPLETQQGDVEREVRNWLSDRTYTRCAILADYGSGKSTFCQHLAAVMAKEYDNERDDPSSSARIPLIIPLGDAGRSFDLEDHLVSHLKKSQVKNADFDALMKMAEAGLLLFMFDGFDEMVSKATVDILKKNIAQIERWAQIRRNKVLVTTRPEYFMNLHEEQEILQKYLHLSLQPFNEAQIDLYLQRRVPLLKTGESAQDWKDYRQQIDRMYDLNDLTHRPVFLETIIKTFPAPTARGQVVNRANLYRTCLDDELERQNRKSGRHLFIGREKRIEIMEKIALELYQTNSTELSSTQIETISSDLLTTEQQKEMQVFLREILACSFLIRKDDKYRFSHTSFLEYLVACQLAKDINNQRQEHFRLKLIDNSTRAFLLELIESESVLVEKTAFGKRAIIENSEYVKELKRWFCEKPHESPTSANVFSLLVRLLSHEQVYNLSLQGANLTGVDLSEVQLQKEPLTKAHLEGANLRGAHLEEANLKDAHLEEADLKDAHLERADLRGARLKKAKLMQAHLTGADLRNAHMEAANLKGASLSDTRLEGANLRRANLEGANLKDAKTFGADLEGANLTGANLEGTDLTDERTWPQS